MLDRDAEGDPGSDRRASDFYPVPLYGTAMSDRATVGEYMTDDVVTVAPGDDVRSVERRIAADDGHNGFPVVEDGGVVGYVTARDLLLADTDATVGEVMSTEPIVAHPEMDVTDAARVIFRSGIRKLPVIDDEGSLVGIISNTDVVRSQIERATPEKVGKLVRTLEGIHDTTVSRERREVPVADLVPTQDRVYADELDGRTYELERGLAEPLVVVQTGDRLLLADGHHRALAADRLGIDRMDASVLVVADDVRLGLERTAEASGLASLSDVEVVDYARHPLVESTERMKQQEPGTETDPTGAVDSGPDPDR
jgi:IMP dehydrogenase